MGRRAGESRPLSVVSPADGARLLLGGGGVHAARRHADPGAHRAPQGRRALGRRRDEEAAVLALRRHGEHDGAHAVDGRADAVEVVVVQACGTQRGAAQRCTQRTRKLASFNLLADGLGELRKAARNMGWRHNVAMPRRPQMTGAAEAAILRVVEGAETLLLTSSIAIKNPPRRCMPDVSSAPVVLNIGKRPRTPEVGEKSKMGGRDKADRRGGKATEEGGISN